MAQKITPFLWFEKDGKAAVEFYLSVFGNNAKLLNAEALDGAPAPTKVFSLELFGQQFTLMEAGPFKKFNESISFVINCDSQTEVDLYWEKLSADPASEQCGWLKDKYGLSWQVVPTMLTRLLGDADKARAGRVMQAMMQMKKIDISKLEAAYNQ
jgi:predicted 3-demethylubiquinone-9 3-methyltransferase (glyoxalase superfamily)